MSPLAPVLFIAFNRPRETEATLKQLLNLGVRDLYISLDAPRIGNVYDEQKCKEVMRVITDLLPADAQVKWNIAQRNLGCKIGVSSAISWFFRNVEAGIIVEDDVMISKEFLLFATESLENYSNDSTIWQINGWSPFYSNELKSQEFYLSRYPMIWGWATWKSKWIQYSPHLQSSDLVRFEKEIGNGFLGLQNDQIRYWLTNFESVVNGLDTWDYQWVYRIWSANGRCLAVPERLTTNFGFDSNATHTFTASKRIKEAFCLETIRLPYSPLSPREMDADVLVDYFQFSRILSLRVLYAIFEYIRICALTKVTLEITKQLLIQKLFQSVNVARNLISKIS